MMKRGQHAGFVRKFVGAPAVILLLTTGFVAVAPAPLGQADAARAALRMNMSRERPASARYLAQAPSDAVVPPVAREKPAAEPPAGSPPAPAPEAAPATSRETPEPGLVGQVQDWLARANREFQGTVVRELSVPSTDGEDAIARKLQETKEEEARSAALRREEEARQKAEAERLAAEAAAKAAAAPPAPPTDAVARAAEDARLVEERRRERERLEAEAKRIEDERKAAELKRLEEERARAESERIAAEAQARAEADRLAREAAEKAAFPKETTRTVAITTEPVARYELAALTRRRASADDAGQPSTQARQAGRRSSHASPRRSVGPARCGGAGRKIKLPGRYTLKRGDTLWSIAKRHYRIGRFYRIIWRANRRSIRNPNLVYPCQRVFLPRRARRASLHST